MSGGVERDAGQRVRSLAELLRQDLAGAARRLFDHEAGVRLGEDPEAVHQARVGIRRLRSTLRTFQPVLDRQWSDALRAELAWIAELLGKVRDQDVLLERLRHDLAALPRAGDDQAAGERLLRGLEQRRDRDRAVLLEAMDSPRYLALRERVAQALAAPALLPAAAGSALEVGPALVARRWRRLRGEVAAAGSEPSDEQLHRIRIEAKRCRYAAEAVGPVAGEPAKAFARAVAALQEVLGEQHDAVVAQTWLREAVSSPGPRVRRAEAFVAGQLVAAEHARAAAARAAWREVWDQAAAKRLRRWL
jgi:CHAD domain-containing protein